MKEIMKKNKKTLVVILILLLVLVTASTYAWLRLTKNSNTINKITAGNLELVLDDTMSDGIKLEKAVPISDAEGEKGTEYTFTLENKGTVDLNYYLYLNDIDLAEGETRLEDNKVRYKLVKDNNVVTATNVGMYRIIFVEGNYTFDFDITTHKFSSVVQSDGSTVTGLADYLNSQLSENATFNDGYQVVKKTFGSSNTYKIIRERNSKLISSMKKNSDNKILDNGQINSKQKITYKLHIWIDKDAETEVMGKIFNARLSLKAEQKGIILPTKTVCKRATTLHTEICSNEDNSGFCQTDGYELNGTITYGNLGTKGILTSGDAFDCDVNGDGVYDSATERFYYVSDMTNGVTTDANTAVLIYYNNVSGGVASNSTGYVYDSSEKNNNGPVTAIEQLPTTSQWKNVSLTNTTRTITNENGGSTTSAGNLPTAFSYEGYAARLLTYQEVYNGCYDGSTSINSTKGLSTKCKYLMENTSYSSSSLKTSGGWLESPSFKSTTGAWSTLAYSRYVYSCSVYNPTDSGVRPAIEVPKSNILY